jgi:hypothetical protein
MAKNPENPVYDQLQCFADRIRQVARGTRTACACDGPAGVGKSYTLSTVAAEEGKPYRLVATTAGSLVQVAHQYANLPILAFDDFDKVLRNEATANVVKQLIASEPVRRITHQTVTAMNNQKRKGGPVSHIAPPTFNVRCGLVMLTNVDMTNPDAIDKRMQEHVNALKDRGLEFVHISRNVDHIADYVIWLATEEKLLEKSGLQLSGNELDEVITFFQENLHRFETVSVRRLQSIAKDRLTMPARWQILQTSAFPPDPPSTTPRRRSAKK